MQGIVAPAKDRLLYGTAGRAMAMIPGIGNTVNGVSELLLGSGIMIRNCVGAAGLIVLIILVAVWYFFIKLQLLWWNLLQIRESPDV